MSIGGLRALTTLVDYYRNRGQEIKINWYSDTWNNTNNKPILLVVVGDEVYEVPTANYDYIHHSWANYSSLHIAYNVRYKPGDNEVRFYLCDKRFYNKESKTLTFNGLSFNGKNRSTLKQGDNDYDFMFTAVTTIEKLKAKQAVNFVPLGTFVVFGTTHTSNTIPITIKSDCFDLIAEVDLKTGLSKTASGEVSTNLNLNGNTLLKPSYSFYCIPRASGSKLNISKVFTKTHTINNPASYSGKVVVLSPRNPTSPTNEWFITEWSGGEIRINRLTGTNIVAEYREKGTTNWIAITPYGNRIYETIPAGKTYELRLSGISSINIIPKDESDYRNYNNTLKAITQWGTTKWTTMNKAFRGCNKLDVTAQDTPDLSICTDLSFMFWGCGDLRGNGKFNSWNTSNIRNMSYTFYGTGFNQPIDNWNTSNVTDISYMFADSEFNNRIVNNAGWTSNNWNTFKVTNMEGVFFRAYYFNQDISLWNVSNVKNMSRMFQEAKNFNQPLVWNTGKVEDMTLMFFEARSFNRNISNWNVSNVRYVGRDIFKGCPILDSFKPKFR